MANPNIPILNVNLNATNNSDNDTFQPVFENGTLVRKFFAKLVGTNGADIIDALGGNDLVFANDGADFVNGNTGDDTINGGGGDDRLDGGLDNDTINGDAGNDILRGEDGKDTLNGGANNDILEGGIGDDILDGGADDDQLFGGSDNDKLFASQGNDILDGDAGTDIADYSNINEAITLQFTGQAITKQTSTNPAADGTVSKGSLGVDSLFDMETIVGKAGLRNTVDVFGTPSNIAVQVNLGGESLRFTDGTVSRDYIVKNFVNVTGSAQGDNIVGNRSANILSGGGGDDTISGGGTFGVPPQDTLNGGDGKDILNGANGNDILNGDADKDTLNGGDGNDILNGGSESDIFIASQGNDILNGGTNTNDGQFPFADTADYGSLNQAITLQVNGFDTNGVLATVNKASQGIDSLNGIEQVFAKAGLNNSIDFSNLAAPLSAIGALRVDGNGGNVLIRNGNSTVSQISVANVNKIIGSSQNDGLSLKDFSSSGIQGTIIGGDGDDGLSLAGLQGTLTGDNGNDTLNGSSGNDILLGGNDSDRLIVSRGIDTLTGGADADRFVYNFNNLNDNDKAIITDFSFAEGDKIEIKDSGFGGVTSLSQFSFTNNTLFFDQSPNDNAAAITFAQLQPNSGFNVSQDLIIV